MNYEYDYDCPFEAFITNLGKYNEGVLAGGWLKLPASAEDLARVLKKAGIGETDYFGAPYEEWFISDYDCYVKGLYDRLGEYESLDELNFLASRLEEMDEVDFDTFCAVIASGEHDSNIKEMINLTENLDCYSVYFGVNSHEDLGRFLLEECDPSMLERMGPLANYIDYEAYGRDAALSDGGVFTDFGYVVDCGGRFLEYYDGRPESIPDEYRITGEAFNLLGDANRAETMRKAAAFLQKENYLKNAELSLEDDYDMIDGILNNGKKPSVKEQLELIGRVCEKIPYRPKNHKSNEIER